MNDAVRLAASSHDNHLTLRRVERQQRLIERLYGAPGRVTLGQLAGELHVSERTLARDVERLRHSGVPITATPGRGGGIAMGGSADVGPIALDVAEISALMASLVALGPTATDSAASAMDKLTRALRD